MCACAIIHEYSPQPQATEKCSPSREFSVLQPGDEAMRDSFYELPKDFQRKSLKGLGMGAGGSTENTLF